MANLQITRCVLRWRHACLRRELMNNSSNVWRSLTVQATIQQASEVCMRDCSVQKCTSEKESRVQHILHWTTRIWHRFVWNSCRQHSQVQIGWGWMWSHKESQKELPICRWVQRMHRFVWFVEKDQPKSIRQEESKETEVVCWVQWLSVKLFLVHDVWHVWKNLVRWRR